MMVQNGLIQVLVFSGTPASGPFGTFAGLVGPGDILVSSTSGSLYRNTGSTGVPVWTAMGGNSSGSNSVGNSGDIQTSDGIGGFVALVPAALVPVWISSPSSANLFSALTSKSGTGLVVFNNSPALVTPDLGTPSAINLANALNIPLSAAAGNLAVSHLAGGASATASTFWCGNGTWATPSSSSGGNPTRIYNAPVTGATITMSAGNAALQVDPAGAIAALTVVLPPTPADNDIFELSTSQTITTLTANPAAAETVKGNSQMLTANGGVKWYYRNTGTTWFRVY